MPLVIDVCHSGEEAIDYLKENETDIMLLDIIMPGINGIEILKQVKADKKLQFIEVLMFSSLDDKETLHDCFELGAVDYIAKPIDELEFLARIKSAIRKKTLEKSGLSYLREIESQNQSLMDLNLKLKTAQNQIIQQEKMASVGHLAAGIAHEINNPLGFITSNIITLKSYIDKYKKLFDLCKRISDEGPDSAGFEEMIQYVNRQEFQFINEDFIDLFRDTQEGLDRVGAIVKGLRNFSRIDQLEEMSLYNLNEGLENTLIICRNELKYIAKVELELGSVPDIYALGGQINQVILNMLLNAGAAIKTKFGAEMGVIHVKTWFENDAVHLSIEDNGMGIDQAHINDIFNPFFTTKPVGEGTGLGLSISYDIIIVKHKGWIEVTSKEGEWTKFVITLPVGENIERE